MKSFFCSALIGVWRRCHVHIYLIECLCMLWMHLYVCVWKVNMKHNTLTCLTEVSSIALSDSEHCNLQFGACSDGVTLKAIHLLSHFLPLGWGQTASNQLWVYLCASVCVCVVQGGVNYVCKWIFSELEWEAEQQFGALYTLFIMVGKKQQPGVEIKRERSFSYTLYNPQTVMLCLSSLLIINPFISKLGGVFARFFLYT